MIHDLSTRDKYADDLESRSRSFSTASLHMWLSARVTLCLYGIGGHRVSVRPSVCLSQAGVVPKWLTCRITQTTLHDSPGTLWFYDAKDIYELPTESLPTGARNAGELDKNCVLRPVQKSLLRRLTAENMCPSATCGGPRKHMRCHQHLTLMQVEIWWSQLRSSWHQHGWL